MKDLDKLRLVINMSLEDHKNYSSEYWKGSAFMGESILKAIDQIEELQLKQEA